MALTPLSSKAKYKGKARDLLDQCDSLPKAVWGVTWEEMLESYDWRGKQWRQTEAIRQRQSEVLQSAVGGDQVRNAVDAITDWGQVQRFDEAELRNVEQGMQSLPLLDACRISSADFYSARIASTSKVYASVDLESWVIFDSRVARALALMVRHVGTLDQRFFLFPQPPDRGHRRRVEGFPALSSVSSRQASLAFLYSSWLCRAIADRIDSIGVSARGGRWTAQRVEMALFAAGAN